MSISLSLSLPTNPYDLSVLNTKIDAISKVSILSPFSYLEYNLRFLTPQAANLFPKSQKAKWIRENIYKPFIFCLVVKSCLTLCNPMGCSPPGSMGFSRQGYWSGVPSPSLVLASTVQQTESAVCISSPRGSPVLGIEPTSLASPAREMQLVGAFFTTAPCRKIGIHISPLFLNFLPI